MSISDAISLVQTLQIKLNRLLDCIRTMRRVVVALSGGVDSSVVAAAAHQTLGTNALAVTAHSPSVAQSDRFDASRIAQLIGIEHVIINTAEFSNPKYIKNDGSRCYYCKTELYDQIQAIYPAAQGWTVLSGANLDDLGDFRPGLLAAAEHAVRHPLQEAGLTKAEVRELARSWHLPVADKPASPCLSSRLAPGVPATPDRTARIEAAEKWLIDNGLFNVRVRLHADELVRLEIPIDQIQKLVEPAVREALIASFSQWGFRFITLDLEGFRSGSLNQLIQLDMRQRFAPAEVIKEHASTTRS